MPTKNLLLLVDGNAILHRAWHAIPPLTAPDGTVVNAVYGFLSLLFKAVKELKPTAIAVAWDRKEPTFRHELYHEYKATREKKPDELYVQIPIIQDMLCALGVATVDAKGYEADDIIATLVERSTGEAIILTGDMDALQLIGPHTRVMALRKGITDTVLYDEAEFESRFGFPVNHFVDYKALRGDPSDNIPGVPGIGEKTATELIKKFGDLNSLYKQLSSRATPRDLPISTTLKDKLLVNEKVARESLQLVTLVRNIPLPHDLEPKLKPMPRDPVVKKLQTLGFKSLLTRLPAWVAGGSEVKSKTVKIVSSAAEIKAVAKDLAQADACVVRIIRTGGDKFGADMLGLGLFSNGEVVIIDLSQDTNARLGLIQPILENSEIKKIGHGLKADIEALYGHHVELSGLLTDIEVASYLCAAGTRSHELGNLAFEELGVELGGRAKPQGQLLPPTLPDLAPAVASELEAIDRLAPIFTERLSELHAKELYDRVELPLVPVLATVEENGAAIDVKFLRTMGSVMKKKVTALEAKMMKIAGEPFNPNSPKELQHILFEKLEIPAEGLRKTAKSGALSTAAAELDKLRGLHPIIDIISEYRELAKLNATYVEALPALVHPKTGRVHTTYNQTVTATGRLSSSDPNLQNIPIRTELGREIRKAFIAEPGNVLLGFDYSQIELRIIASLANDERMIKAFQSGRDIHAETASAIWGVAGDQVTKEMRRNAKTVNFGILYGMGASGLAQGAEVSYAEAKDFILKYFNHYRGIAAWIEATKVKAKKDGYVETLLGRRRYLPDITSGMPQVRAAAERMAVNMPVQGTAADMIKMAMVQIDKELGTRNQGLGRYPSTHYPVPSSSIYMILQVHDELVFECSHDLVRGIAPKIKEIMERVVTLKVPVVVDVSVGTNWGAMKPL